MSRFVNDNIYDELRYWDFPWKPEQEIFTPAPDFVRVNSDGNFEAVWWEKVIDTEDGSEHLATVTVVEFTPDRFVFTYAQDILVYHEGDSVPTDEEGEPYWSSYGEEYCDESVEFDRRALLQFLLDLRSGKLKRTSQRHPVRGQGGQMFTYAEHFWAHTESTPAARRSLPRDRAELARWVAEAGYEYVRSMGSGCEYTSELPEAAGEIDLSSKRAYNETITGRLI